MSFNQAAVNTLISNVKSNAQKLGLFQQVITHEPKSPPQHDMTLAIWLDSVKPNQKYSGLASVAGTVTFFNRIYMNFLAKPEDQIDSKILTGMSALINGYAGGFSLGSSVVAVDLLGIDSQGLAPKFGYVQLGQTWFRQSTLLVSVIIDNLWTETP